MSFFFHIFDNCILYFFSITEVDNCGNDLDVPMEQSVAVHKMTTSIAPATFAGVLKGRPKDKMSGTEV